MQILITGGIGSGKTTVARMFQELGVPVYFTDDENRELMKLPEVQERYNELFQTECFDESGKFKKELVSIFYNDEVLKSKVEEFVIPLLSQRLTKWQNEQTYPYTLVENAVAIELGVTDRFDRVIVVYCSETTRFQRVFKRDGKTAKEIHDIMKKQTTDRIRLRIANHVILTHFKVDGRLMDIKEQVIKLHNILLKSANEKTN